MPSWGVHTNDEEGEAIEKRSNVSEAPEDDEPLDGVYKVLDEEHRAKSINGSVHLLSNHLASLSDLVLWQWDLHL